MPLVFSAKGQKYEIPEEVLHRYVLEVEEPIEECSFLDGQLIVQVFWAKEKGDT